MIWQVRYFYRNHLKGVWASIKNHPLNDRNPRKCEGFFWERIDYFFCEDLERSVTIIIKKKMARGNPKNPMNAPKRGLPPSAFQPIKAPTAAPKTAIKKMEVFPLSTTHVTKFFTEYPFPSCSRQMGEINHVSGWTKVQDFPSYSFAGQYHFSEIMNFCQIFAITVKIWQN